MNDRPKVVFSSSLTDADWENTRIERGDLATSVAALKEEHGDGILVAHGGPTFVRSLVATGLVDEYRMLIHPVVVGEGRSIFSSLAHLDVVHVEPFSSGAVGITLRPKQEASE
jgi:dihydrofolate reductase